MTAPKYIIDVMRRLADAGVTSEAGVLHIEIAHDRDCPLLRGAGPCACNPEIGMPQREQ